MTDENEQSNREEREDPEQSLLEEVGHRIRYIHRKVNEIASQVEDNYHALRYLLDSAAHENGASWHDLYEDDTEYS